MSEQTIGLQTGVAQIQYFYVSVVAARPQAILLYVEQAALVTQPDPFVVQIERAAEQPESVVSVTGNRAQVRFMHEFETVLQAQVTVDPEIGTLLHGIAVENPPQVVGFVRHSLARSQPRATFDPPILREGL